MLLLLCLDITAEVYCAMDADSCTNLESGGCDILNMERAYMYIGIVPGAYLCMYFLYLHE